MVNMHKPFSIWPQQIQKHKMSFYIFNAINQWNVFKENLLCRVFKGKDHEKSPVSNLILGTRWSKKQAQEFSGTCAF